MLIGPGGRIYSDGHHVSNHSYIWSDEARLWELSQYLTVALVAPLLVQVRSRPGTKLGSCPRAFAEYFNIDRKTGCNWRCNSEMHSAAKGSSVDLYHYHFS